MATASIRIVFMLVPHEESVVALGSSAASNAHLAETECDYRSTQAKKLPVFTEKSPGYSDF
jgi:hypothetical protein